MSTILPLYPYQEDCLDAIFTALKTQRSTAVELATGMGKTVIFSHLVSRWKHGKPLVLAHTDELVTQAEKKVRRIAPHLNVGVVKAERNEMDADVIIGSVQTLRRRTPLAGIGLVVTDECHHAQSPTYKRIYAQYDVPHVGFTATLSRTDGKPLGEIYESVAFVRSTPWAVRKGILANPVAYRVQVPDLNLSGVRGRHDYREEDLGEALVTSMAPELIVKAWREHADGKKTVLFAPTVESARVFAAAFGDAEVIHGGMSLEERRLVLKRHREGDFPVLANCMILTEGYDDPSIECVIIARPTKSKGLYIQMVGRGLRTFPGKTHCIVLDVTGVEHNLCSLADLSTKPVKEVRDGQSLTGAEDEFDAGVGVEEDPEHYYTGPVEVREFDLLASQSNRCWLKTRGGVYFMRAGEDAYVWLRPTLDGDYVVAWAQHSRRVARFACCHGSKECRCGKGSSSRGASSEYSGDLAMAMAWGEDLAVDMGADPFETLSKKAAPWRRKRPSEKMTSFADSLRVRVLPTDSAGVLSDRIDRKIATGMFDGRWGQG